MSVTVVVSCNGAWDKGRMPCRGAFPATRALSFGSAVKDAIAAGWSETRNGHLCPAHTRIAGEKAS
jgi:hypothetical protein